MHTTDIADKERFEKGAKDYAAYLETPEGRLRSDLAFANVEDFLPQPGSGKPLRALDVGCGTGVTGIRLARLGIQVTLLDSSESMLEIAKIAARKEGVVDSITVHAGDAGQVTNLFDTASFDLIVCHNVLEFVEEPIALLRKTALAMRDSSSLLSVLVRNRAGEVVKAALLAGDLAAAEANLNAKWGQESLYGGKVRLFTPCGLQEMLKMASLEPFVERGVRVLADYLPSKISRNAEYERIFDLERKLGKLPEYAAVARYTHCLARRTDP